MKAENAFPRAVPTGRVSVYFHIPFCTRKCAYCDFYSVPLADNPAGTRSAPQTVLEAEIRQFDYYLEQWRPSVIPTIYIGGGTPSVIPPEMLRKFLEEITRRLPAPPGEFTIEANPESLTREFLSVCAASGLTRISLGLQSFDPRCLQALGRYATPEDVQRALHLTDRFWKGELSLDLMYGIPGQTFRAALADAAQALEHSPGHISLYALTPEEGTPLYNRLQAGETPAINENRQEFIRAKVHRFLLERGYENYEISSYALPGKQCRHNTAYWKLEPYIGIGPAAVSTLPAAAGPVRLSGIRDMSAYIQNPCLPEVEHLSARDFLADYILLGLRTSKGIDLNAFFRVFHLDFPRTFSRLVHKNRQFIAKISNNDTAFTLTGRGRRVLNTILVDFLIELDQLKYTSPPAWPDKDKPNSGAGIS
ncbi:MAG: radical SAM family heme chaperone HemW [Spirochaetales bacterium]|jgi:oxygen-independent coproporphyrinogen-3 oxidase|nr:radical SAM family heme chaperone HemW [Spirochaetales bacterium]